MSGRVAREIYAIESATARARALVTHPRRFLLRCTCRPPVRKTECQDEEAAFLACKPDTANKLCGEPVRAYVQCADRVLLRLMNPSSTAASASLR